MDAIGMRALCVYLPMWSVDLARRRARKAAGGSPELGGMLLLVSMVSNTQKVSRCCWGALDAGVRPGMTVAHARALTPEASVIAYQPRRDREAMTRLAEWASRFSPIVGVDPSSWDFSIGPQTKAQEEMFCPDGLILDITGCARALGGEERLGFAVAAGLRRMGFECRVGIGPSIGSAWAAARYSGERERFLHVIRSPRDVRAAMGPMPVRALRVDDATEEALRELGVERVEQVLALPRRALPSRFGGLITRRIDQAFGEAMETITPVRPPPPLRVERLFDGPTTQVESVELCARELLEELCSELLSRESGVRVLEAIFDRVKRDARGTEPVVERITLSRPTRSGKHLWSLLRPRIEKLHLGNGIDGISLVTPRVTRLRHAQRELSDAGPARRPGGEAGAPSVGFEELVDTLVNRLGSDRVVRAELVESHVPERGFRYVGAEVDRRAALPMSIVRGVRPSVLFEEPEPAEAVALMPDRAPSVVRWRGEELKVSLGVGPERIGAEWWRWHEQETEGTHPGRAALTHPPAESLSPRDYFRVREERGRWVWVYREVYTGRWFVHGVWG